MSKIFFLLLFIPLLSIGFIYSFSFKIILSIILIILSIILYFTFRNSKLIIEIIKENLSLIKNINQKIKPLDLGEFDKLKIYNIFPVISKVYHLEGIGILSIMTCNVGIMQLMTFSINPFEKDLPLMSSDIIFIFGKITFIFGFYELMLDKENKEYKYFLNNIEKINKKYEDIKIFNPKKEWHTEILSAIIGRTIGVKQIKILSDIYKEVFNYYITYSKNIDKLNKNEIAKKVSLVEEFGNNLVDKGGYSTDTFKKFFGVEKTRKFLGKVIFGYYSFKEHFKL